MTSAEHRPVPAPTAHTDVLVLDYLAALWAAAEDLSPETRDELMTAAADYIALRRADTEPEYVLRLLGPPEALAAAARRGRIPLHVTGPLTPPPPPPPARASGSRVPEWTAVLLLTVGAVLLPVIGPVAGLLVMTGSPRWTGSQKAAAAGVAIGTGLLGLMFGLALAIAGVAELGVFVAYLAAVAGPVGAGLTLVPGLTDRAVPRRTPGWR